MSGYARYFNNIETLAVIKFFFPARQGAEGNSRILTETLGGHTPSYVTLKNWMAQLIRDFFTCVAPRPGRPKTVTTKEIID
jgi:hypothetical protein